MTTNRELLESAAKAAGLTHLTYCEAWDCMAVYNQAGGYFEWGSYWNPRRDSDDAMNLIAHLQLCVQGHDDGVTAGNSKGTIIVEVDYNSGSETDKTAATLLAITRVAAAIGGSQ
jgi:hypothetical protein